MLQPVGSMWIVHWEDHFWNSVCCYCHLGIIYYLLKIRNAGLRSCVYFPYIHIAYMTLIEVWSNYLHSPCTVSNGCCPKYVHVKWHPHHVNEGDFVTKQLSDWPLAMYPVLYVRDMVPLMIIIRWMVKRLELSHKQW